jgi:4-hydroxy-2-oxoheptanedioate aldolase
MVDDEWRESLATRLREGENLVGLIVKMSAPVNVELAGHVGYDVVVIDTEHGASGGIELDHHIRAADSVGIPVLVRVGTLDRVEIARALDAGATGIIVPQVESAEEARAAVSLSHYPPFGRRGFATSTRAGNHGTTPGAHHLAEARANTMVVVQIESRAGVDNVREILDVDGVSAVWLGLADLSLELGAFGNLDNPQVAAAIDTVVESTDLAGMPLIVIADNENDGMHWTSRGARVLLVNFLTVAANSLKQLRITHQLTSNERSMA